MKYIFAGIITSLSIALFFLYTKTTYDAIQTQSIVLVQYNKILNQITELQHVRDTLIAKNNDIPADSRARLEKFLPDHVDNIRLILDMDNIATQYGMALQNINVAASAESASTIKGTGSSVQSVPIQFSVTATYDTLQTFLIGLEKSLRLIDIVSFTLSPASDNTITAGAARKYTLALSVRTYWVK
jgi:Tfp pilus assembly protein PilO